MLQYRFVEIKNGIPLSFFFFQLLSVFIFVNFGAMPLFAKISNDYFSFLYNPLALSLSHFPLRFVRVLFFLCKQLTNSLISFLPCISFSTDLIKILQFCPFFKLFSPKPLTRLFSNLYFPSNLVKNLHCLSSLKLDFDSFHHSCALEINVLLLYIALFPF